MGGILGYHHAMETGMVGAPWTRVLIRFFLALWVSTDMFVVVGDILDAEWKKTHGVDFKELIIYLHIKFFLLKYS